MRTAGKIHRFFAKHLVSPVLHMHGNDFDALSKPEYLMHLQTMLQL